MKERKERERIFNVMEKGTCDIIISISYVYFDTCSDIFSLLISVSFLEYPFGVFNALQRSSNDKKSCLVSGKLGYSMLIILLVGDLRDPRFLLK